MIYNSGEYIICFKMISEIQVQDCSIDQIDEGIGYGLSASLDSFSVLVRSIERLSIPLNSFSINRKI